MAFLCVQFVGSFIQVASACLVLVAGISDLKFKVAGLGAQFVDLILGSGELAFEFVETLDLLVFSRTDTTVEGMLLAVELFLLELKLSLELGLNTSINERFKALLIALNRRGRRGRRGRCGRRGRGLGKIKSLVIAMMVPVPVAVECAVDNDLSEWEVWERP